MQLRLGGNSVTDRSPAISGIERLRGCSGRTCSMRSHRRDDSANVGQRDGQDFRLRCTGDRWWIRDGEHQRITCCHREDWSIDIHHAVADLPPSGRDDQCDIERVQMSESRCDIQHYRHVDRRTENIEHEVVSNDV